MAPEAQNRGISGKKGHTSSKYFFLKNRKERAMKFYDKHTGVTRGSVFVERETNSALALRPGIHGETQLLTTGILTHVNIFKKGNNLMINSN